MPKIPTSITIDSEECRMKRKRYLIISLTIILMFTVLFHIHIQKYHTFTPQEGEQIQPVFGTVKVRSNCDTGVIFTDIESGKEYIIDYITPGMTETIKLQKNKWYTTSGGGNVTVSPVNIRIE